MNPRLNILYRGPLESCNYDCAYCPFAKTKDSRAELNYDTKCLNRFVDWVERQNRDIGILFTPWGEGLIRKHYQAAMLRLSHFPNVRKVAIQTNLSCRLNWLQEANQDSLALWTTFHPTETTIRKFVRKCERLIELGINFSVGIVGTQENFNYASELRHLLPPEIYVWINAYKREADYYSPEDIVFLNSIDPLFDLNNQVYQSLGKACFAGESSLSIDGEGNVTRCHFIKKRIGNIYESELNDILRTENCSTVHCRCYIGYFNLKELNLKATYGDQILERIPKLSK